jgi:hypothetical protein
MRSDKKKGVATAVILTLAAAVAVIVLLIVKRELRKQEHARRLRARRQARIDNRNFLSELTSVDATLQRSVPEGRPVIVQTVHVGRAVPPSQVHIQEIKEETSEPAQKVPEVPPVRKTKKRRSAKRSQSAPSVSIPNTPSPTFQMPLPADLKTVEALMGVMSTMDAEFQAMVGELSHIREVYDAEIAAFSNASSTATAPSSTVKIEELVESQAEIPTVREIEVD